MPTPSIAPRPLLLRLWWLALVIGATAFFIRDVPTYLDYRPENYGELWDRRGATIPHVFAAAVAFVVGFLQFSRRLRSQRPRLHRALGYVYFAGTLVGAPAAIFLGLKSSCALCRPPLTLLGVLWGSTTLMAVAAARNRDFTIHRAFMVRSFGLMNVFTLIRLLDDVPIPGLQPAEQRVIWEWTAMAVIVIGLEIALTWRPALQRLRAPRRAPATGV